MTSALTDMIEIPEKGRQNGAEEKKKKRIKKKKVYNKSQIGKNHFDK